MVLKDNRFAAWAVSAWLCLFAATLAANLVMASGAFVYTLDDPYIHLAVARNILSGGYGVNLGEYSSPSSSILWPWLMAATEALGLGAYGPLLVNAAAAAATVWVAARFLTKLGLVDPAARPREALVFCAIVILATSSVALPLTGMEHMLHVLAAVVVLDGLVDIAHHRAPTPVLALAIAAMPLLRFEGFAFALSALAALVYFRAFAAAACATALIAGGLAAYGAFTLHHGLPFFPSSVLVKSTVVASMESHSLSAQILGQLRENLAGSLGAFSVCALAVISAAIVLLIGRDRRAAVVLLAVASAFAGHLVLGRNGWFYRYEVYAVAIAALATILALAILRLQMPRLARIAMPLALLICMLQAQKYGQAIFYTPLGARNIAEQQLQMRRLAQDFYKGPVAVNDLGLVSYGNSHYVLDLFGLGSETVRKLRTANALTPERMDELVRAHRVGLVMVYDGWFPLTPPSWRRVAELKSRDKISAAFEKVAIFAASDAELARVTDALSRLKATLPPGSTISFATPTPKPAVGPAGSEEVATHQ